MANSLYFTEYSLKTLSVLGDVLSLDTLWGLGTAAPPSSSCTTYDTAFGQLQFHTDALKLLKCERCLRQHMPSSLVQIIVDCAPPSFDFVTLVPSKSIFCHHFQLCAGISGLGGLVQSRFLLTTELLPINEAFRLPAMTSTKHHVL